MAHLAPPQSGQTTPPDASADPRPAPETPLHDVLNLLPDGMLFLDRSWQFTFANQEAIRLLRSGPLVGENLWELFPNARQEPFHSSFRRAMEQRVSVDFEAFYPEPLHSWFRSSVRPYMDGIAIIFSDITLRRAAEERRDDAAQHIEEVFEATADVIVCLGPDWNITYSNTPAQRLLGDRLLGDSLWTRLPRSLEEPFASNYRRVMAERVTADFEAYVPDPLHAWFHVIARPFRDGILIRAVDITARKLAELQRDRTAGALGQVLEVTTDGILSLDRAWRITFVNRRGTELLAGFSNLLGQTLWEAFPDAALPGSPFLDPYHRAMHGRVPSSFEAFYPDPLNLWFSIDARPSQDGIIIFFRDITADRLATAALKQQAGLLSAVQQASLIATWELDLRSGEITFGAGSYPVFGRPLDQTRTLADLERWIPEDARPAARAALAGATDTGALLAYEFPITADDGSLLWIEHRGQVIDIVAPATHMRGISIDVTARRRNEDELRSSENRYRMLTDLNPQFIWMGTSTGEVTYANQRFIEYIGRHHHPDHSNRWIEAFHPDDRERVLDRWTRSVTTGEEYDVEARLLRDADHAARWFQIRAQPIRNDAGAILSWLGIAIDIHERRTFAETLRAQQLETERQRAELESIYENTPIGLALFDPVEFRYLRLNDELARTIGLPKSQILGRSILEVVPGVVTLGELFRQVATGKPVRNRIVEGEQVGQPGVLRSWNVNYFPIYDSTGKITGITSASLEITQQRKAEAALMQSEKLAAVGRLASSISHEINNPLEAITNLLYLVAQDTNLPQELKVYVHMAQSELSRVSQIATQTLRFHRQAVGATSVTPAQLVTAVLNLYQGRLSNSGIQVDARYRSSTEILCFENDIRQVLNNLIANAIDAMRTGGCLKVRAHDSVEAATGRPGVRITVADTGHGMSRATQKRLFEPFYTTKGLNGTGLGLWISSEIVTRHQGRLTLRSSQHPSHHGTVFHLFLPLQESLESKVPSQTNQIYLP